MISSVVMSNVVANTTISEVCMSLRSLRMIRRDFVEESVSGGYRHKLARITDMQVTMVVKAMTRTHI